MDKTVIVFGDAEIEKQDDVGTNEKITRVKRVLNILLVAKIMRKVKSLCIMFPKMI